VFQNILKSFGIMPNLPQILSVLRRFPFFAYLDPNLLGAIMVVTLPDSPSATQVAIPVSLDDFVALIEFLRLRGGNRDPSSAVSEAIRHWMLARSASDGTPLPVEASRAAPRGYNWQHGYDNVFLPEGTELRMKYKRYMYYAKVLGDEIIFGGKPVSPAMMATEIAKSPRNAWVDLWVFKPGQEKWIRADSLRRVRPKDQLKLMRLGQPRMTENGRGHRELLSENDMSAGTAMPIREALSIRKSRVQNTQPKRTTKITGRKIKLIPPTAAKK
jgi:hypothetical protein